jgi:hypothetical protein
MQNIETLKLKGELQVVLNKADGSVETHDFKNLVVNTGLNFIVERMKNDSTDQDGKTQMSHMELGEGTTAAAAGDTALETPITGSRTGLTSTDVATNTITYVATFGAGTGTGAVTEAGLFNDATAGDMLCRTVFPVVNKQSGDSMTVTWVVTVS